MFLQISLMNNFRKQNYCKHKMRERLMMKIIRRMRMTTMLTLYQLVLMAFYQISCIRRPITRRCKRLPRTQGWWNIVWNTFNDKPFKQNFRVTKAIFLYILHEVEPTLSKGTVAEEPVPSRIRLAVCLYRLVRGDYLHTVG